MTAARVRLATAEDLDGIAAVDDAFRRAGTPEWSLMPRRVFELMRASDMLIVADEGEGRIVGYLAWSLLWGFPFVDYARIVEDRRGRGTGSAMLDLLTQNVRARGWRMIWSSTQDARALRWHEKNGFRTVGTTKWIWGNAPETFLMKEL